MLTLITIVVAGAIALPEKTATVRRSSRSGRRVFDALRRHGTVSEHTDEDGTTNVQRCRTGLVGFASKRLSTPNRPDGHATG